MTMTDPKLGDFSLSNLPGAEKIEVPTAPPWSGEEIESFIRSEVRNHLLFGPKTRLNFVLPIAAALEWADMRGFQRTEFMEGGLLDIARSCYLGFRWGWFIRAIPVVQVGIEPTENISPGHALALRYRIANEKRARGMKLKRVDLDALGRR